MEYYDVFNGDADGICSLIQIRLENPRNAHLVTGVKRDISLLSRVFPEKSDHLTVLDISMEKNQDALRRVLAAGASVFYSDHHRTGEIPDHPLLEAHIDLSSSVCTSLIVNKLLNGKFLEWALVGAFGDNLDSVAINIAEKKGLSQVQIDSLRELGVLINYNGYGPSVDKLFFDPRDLYAEFSRYKNPLVLLEEGPDTLSRLREGFNSDVSLAGAVEPHYQSENVAVYVLPQEDWALRVSGVFGNKLAREAPSRAHAIVTPLSESEGVVSLRAPLENPMYADEIASEFPSGGGRRRAAGINSFALSKMSDLVASMEVKYSQ